MTRTSTIDTLILGITLLAAVAAAPIHAEAWGDLEVGLQASQEVVEDGSVALLLELPAEALEYVTLAVDGEPAAEGEDLGSSFVLDTTILPDGEHHVVLSADSPDGRSGGADPGSG